MVRDERARPACRRLCRLTPLVDARDVYRRAVALLGMISVLLASPAVVVVDVRELCAEAGRAARNRTGRLARAGPHQPPRGDQATPAPPVRIAGSKGVQSGARLMAGRTPGRARVKGAGPATTAQDLPPHRRLSRGSSAFRASTNRCPRPCRRSGRRLGRPRRWHRRPCPSASRTRARHRRAARRPRQRRSGRA